jgi:hypothetical protein
MEIKSIFTENHVEDFISALQPLIKNE